MKTLYAAVSEYDVEHTMGEVYPVDTMDAACGDARECMLEFDLDVMVVYKMTPVRILRWNITEEAVPPAETPSMYGAGVGVEGR